KEIEFASGAGNDPYGFKPTDVVVERDGSLIVVDWADGQRPKRGRGRVYRIAPVEPARAPGPRREPSGRLEDLIARLDSASYYQRTDAQAALEQRGRAATGPLREALLGRKLGVRGRMHGVWALAHANGSVRELLDVARTDPEPRVQVQALRAVADLNDP